MTPAYLGGVKVRGFQEGRLVKPGFATTSATAVPATSSLLYVGARIDGTYQNTRGATTTNDAPFCTVDAAPNPWDTFEGVNGANVPSSGMAGKRLSMVQWGNDSTTPWNFAGSIATRARSRGAFSMWTLWMTPTNVSDALANNSTFKSSAGTMFAAMKAHGFPFLVRMMWEFNGNWGYPWQTNAGVTSANFVTIWRNIWQVAADVYRPGGTAGDGLGTAADIANANISFFWCPNYYTTAFEPGIKDPTPWYPGDQYVDWVGWDGYQRAAAPAAKSDVYWSPMTRFKDTYDLLVTITAGKPSLPMMIGEFGVSNAAASPGASGWLTAFFDSFLPYATRLKGFHYFDEHGGDGSDTCLEDLVSSGGLAVWQNRIADDTKFARNIAGTFTSGQKLPIPS
jgi:hypothetical protein